jgi:long-chain fatty acid transport protein
MSWLIKTVIGATLTTIIAQQTAQAGGFSLYTEASGAEIGTFAAGSAAEAADASTAWYNPAGLVFLNHQQLVFSGAGVFPSSKLTGTSTFTTPHLRPDVQAFSNLQGAKDAFVPALHYAQPLGERTAFGVSVVSPFGLSTNWLKASPVRYEATLTQLITMDVSPEIAGLLTDNFSVGAGIDFEWARVKFNRMLGAPTIALPPTAFDSLSFNQAQSFGTGFHAGVLGTFNDHHTRIGLNYQSRIKHQFNGHSTLSGRLADPEFDNPAATYTSESLFSNAINLPDVLTLSGYQDINAKLALMASVVYTGWDTFKVIQLNQVAAFSLSQSSPQILANSVAEENYRNTWRFAVGANYRLTDEWMMRVGGGYDQTPTVDSARDVRLPDSDRWTLAIGTHYQLTPSLGFDAGYSYLFGENDIPINKTDSLSTSSYNVHASGKSHAQLLGVQAVWTMDQVGGVQTSNH